MLLLYQGGICHFVGRVSLTKYIHIYIYIFTFICTVGQFGRLTYHKDAFENICLYLIYIYIYTYVLLFPQVILLFFYGFLLGTPGSCFASFPQKAGWSFARFPTSQPGWQDPKWGHGNAHSHDEVKGYSYGSAEGLEHWAQFGGEISEVEFI